MFDEHCTPQCPLLHYPVLELCPMASSQSPSSKLPKRLPPVSAEIVGSGRLQKLLPPSYAAAVAPDLATRVQAVIDGLDFALAQTPVHEAGMRLNRYTCYRVVAVCWTAALEHHPLTFVCVPSRHTLCAGPV